MPKGHRGSPEKVIDLEELEKLCKMQCTDEEIAAWFDISRERFVKNHKKKPEVLEAMERGRAKGRASLRHAQFSKALAGHPTLLIWLGKQILGQKDTVITEHTGEMMVYEGARDKLLGKLARLAEQRGPEQDSKLLN